MLSGATENGSQPMPSGGPTSVAAPEVFLSYARRDAHGVLKLARDLRAAGIKLWVDQLDIPPGARWDDAVQTALKTCASVLVVLSPASVESQNVLNEVAYALNKNKGMFPVLFDDCDIPLQLTRFNNIDLRTDYESGLQRLLQALKGLSRPRSEPPVSRSLVWPPTGRIAAGLGSVVPNYFNDLSRLFLAPKTFFAERRAENVLAASQALTFLAITFLGAYLLKLPLDSKNSLAGFATDAIFRLMTVLGYGAALYAGWRAVGGKASLMKVFAIFFYCGAVLYLFESATFLVFWGALKLFAPDLWQELQDNLFCQGNASYLREMIRNPNPRLAAFFPLTLLGFAPALFWFGAAWGAFRELNDLSKIRSVLAAVVFAVLWLPVTAFIFLVGSALLRPNC